jgi:hypothetical protein
MSSKLLRPWDTRRRAIGCAVETARRIEDYSADRFESEVCDGPKVAKIFSLHRPSASGGNSERCTIRLLNTASGGSPIDISFAVEGSSATVLALVAPSAHAISAVKEDL